MIKILDCDYLLPEKLIAQVPAVPRDHSRLFIYNTQTDQIFFDYFYNLDKYLPEKSFLVLNNTRVVPARVWLTRLRPPIWRTSEGQGGGKVLVLLLLNEQEKENVVKVLVDRKVTIGEKLFIDDDHFFVVIDQKEKIFSLKYNFSKKWLLTILQKIGKTPVPLYLRKNPLSEKQLREKYQTIFSKKGESVAAPTASLHFTDKVFEKLRNKGIKKYEVTLNVGLGTFAPINKENLKTHRLHEEYFQINKQTLQCIKTLKWEGKKLVAVGTTVTRTLETVASSKFQVPNPKQIKNLNNQTIVGKTDLFIFPPYDFKMVDILITNFHLPKSSLMMLVEAFLEDKYKKAPPSRLLRRSSFSYEGRAKLRRAKQKTLVELYQIAIKNNFRFYSFGDAMLII